MKNKLIKIIFLSILLLITIGYTYYFRQIVDDELYNFGFGYSISQGLIPYRDFNMIITPLFSYLLAILISIFGKHLILYHILIAALIVYIFHLSYRNIGVGAFVIYMLLLIYPFVGYNIFTLALLFTLFSLSDNENTLLLEPIIISLMILSKQTLILLAIPNIITSKNKKKTISIYLIFCFAFLLYLTINNCLYNFFDYCLFGMFDFTNKNGTSFNILTILEIIIIILLGYFSYKSKDKKIYYCLMFQIMAFPIFDYIHFIISLIPAIYLLLYKCPSKKIIYLLSMTIILSYFLIFNILVYKETTLSQTHEHYKINNFLKGRLVSKGFDSVMLKGEEYVNKYNNYKIYFLGNLTYAFKLGMDIPINKYDIINDGNMGYGGAKEYIKEIDKDCKKNKCIFIVDSVGEGANNINQLNIDILNYPKNNYDTILNSNAFNVYIN